ncbi:hypothetical protein VN97_g2701 [Penicillium thymicola]|uniref:Uncharacterized protein n=1 Tax=Penicillium thymicola TaxID=293382 RepID=A0AAI9TP36_PENTH|nr:hypothetical protein VN97_g2701 [Penicillium thymicola]
MPANPPICLVVELNELHVKMKRGEDYDHETLTGGAVKARFDADASNTDPATLFELVTVAVPNAQQPFRLLVRPSLYIFCMTYLYKRYLDTP